MSRWLAVSIVAVASWSADAAGVDDLVARVKSAGPEGKGSATAAAAWSELSRQNADSLVPILAGMDGASPVAANWLRSAADAIAERARAAKQPLPAREIEAFLKDTRHSDAGRRIAFELLCTADAAARDRLLPTFMNDPSPELRYDAVQTAFDKVKAQPKDAAAAKDELKKLLNASRNFAQVEAIGKELDDRGEKTELTDHFGFIKRWLVLGSFDNTGGKGFQIAYPPETATAPAGTPPGKGGEPTKWYPTTSAAKYAVVDLNKLIGKVKDAVAYAYAEVESPDDRDVEFRAASATAIKMFVNGKEVFARESYHQSSDPDSHIAVGRLKKGKNTILLKICQNDQKEPWAQEWQYQLRITDALGAKVPVKEVTPAQAN
jgi:hypothetical protein